MPTANRSSRKKKWAKTIEDVCDLFPIRKASLLKAFPDLAAEWDYKRNCGFGPEDFNYGSGIQAWWLCPTDKKHFWQASINHRAARGDGCPFCAGQRVHTTNSLATIFPKIAKELHPTKNGTLKATDITAYTKTPLWWKCKCGFEWRTQVSNRARNGSGCRRCNQNLLNLNDYSEAIKHFDKTKNKNLDPSKISMRTKIHWRCKKGEDHLWQQVFTKKCSPERFCPFCNNRKLSKTNCLANTYPAVAKELHKTKNGGLTPKTLMGTSNKMVFWTCRTCQHTWRAPVGRRTAGHGCPKCWIKNRPLVLKKAAQKRKKNGGYGAAKKKN